MYSNPNNTVTVYRLRELINKCPNVFPIHSESHGKFTESHDGREPLSQAQSAVSNQSVSLIITRPYETAETEHAHDETRCAHDETEYVHDETTRALKNRLILFGQLTLARARVSIH